MKKKAQKKKSKAKSNLIKLPVKAKSNLKRNVSMVILALILLSLIAVVV